MGRGIASDGDDVPDLVRRFAVAMMNRRGMVRAHSHWRPHRRAATTSADDKPSRWHLSLGRVLLTALVTALAGFAIATVALRDRGSGGPALPATPMGWLDAFSAGVARDSGDVCSRLLSPAFRSAMERDAHESCTAYYARAQVLSIRLLRVLRTGVTAALEVRYWPHGGYSTFVLDRQADGWQAVAIVPGGPLPIA
jgi:hypothetical protein